MKTMMLAGSAALVSLVVGLGAQSQEKKDVPKKAGDPEAFIDLLLKQLDSNSDGKIAKSEARGKLADGFTKLDQNADGFLDRKELRAMAGIAALKKGPGPFAAPGDDFDALDRDADGRLTRDELKGSRLLERFADIDANKDGRLDRREFEARQRKALEKK
jgi:Ca2+-binding EF-hand superfamily protein